MNGVKVVCDFCNRPLEFDLERGSYVLYRTKQIDTRKLLPHLCKTCAEKLDDILIESRTRLMSQAEIADRVTKLNLDRREKLGMKG